MHPRLEWQSAALIHPVISFLLFNTDRNLSGAGGGGEIFHLGFQMKLRIYINFSFSENLKSSISIFPKLCSSPKRFKPTSYLSVSLINLWYINMAIAVFIAI